MLRKPCPSCGRTLPLTDEYWARATRRKGGFAGWCKECHYARRNLESLRAAGRRYYLSMMARDPDGFRERLLRWRSTHPEEYRAASRAHEGKRRARSRAFFTDVSLDYVRGLLRQAKRCPLCGGRLTDAPRLPNSKEVDHIFPICAGGTHTVGNLRVICRRCNSSRPRDGSDVQGQPTLWAQL